MIIINKKFLFESDSIDDTILKNIVKNTLDPAYASMRQATKNFDPAPVAKSAGLVTTDFLKNRIDSAIRSTGVRVSDTNSGASQVKAECMKRVAAINSNLNDTSAVAKELAGIGDAIIAGYGKVADKQAYSREFLDKFTEEISDAVVSKWLSTEDDDIRKVVRIICGAASYGKGREEIREIIAVDSPKYASLMWSGSAPSTGNTAGSAAQKKDPENAPGRVSASAGSTNPGSKATSPAPAESPAPQSSAPGNAAADISRFKTASGVDFVKLAWFVDHNWLNPGQTKRCYDMLVAAHSDPSFAKIPAGASYRNRWNLKWYLVGQLWFISKKLGLPETTEWQAEHDALKVNPT